MNKLNPIAAYNRWELDDGRVIYLVTRAQFAALADGTTLLSINGDTKVKGKDYIDEDTRAGWMAWGVLPE